MKLVKSLVAAAAGALLLAGAAQAENFGTSVANSNGVVSSSGAAASVSGNGSSLSQAGNFQVAGSIATANEDRAHTSFLGQPVAIGHADAAGIAATAGGSYVRNVSTGSGSGEAVAGGASVVNLGASSYYDMHGTLPEGTVGGGASSITESQVRTGTNGSAYSLGGAVSGFVGTSDAVKLGNSDSLLFNAAVTTAQAGAIGGEVHGSAGTGSVVFHQNAASAYVNSTAASGNAISGN